MGEAKRKQYSRLEFLAEHRWCAYCGRKAETTDHCPPRCFFDERNWPETYEFPACQKCNQEARLDEQALAVLARINLTEERIEPNATEQARLIQDVRNNQPEIVNEWLNIGASGQKRAFNRIFGPNGFELRRRGWGAINVGGPLTQAMMQRFVIKLAKALYYRHNGKILDGSATFRQLNGLLVDRSRQTIEKILGLAPIKATPTRNSRLITNRFAYRYNYHPDLGVIYAVVEFKPQMIFQVLAYSQELTKMLKESVAAQEQDILVGSIIPCPLMFKSSGYV